MRVAGLVLLSTIAFAPAMTQTLPAQAQDAWPSRTITLVVPYAAGGYTDLVGRLAARFMEKTLGKPVIVENRTGAGGIVGTLAVVNSKPDGYTFCVCSIGAISIAPFLQKTGYDPLNDLEPVGAVSSISQVVVVKNALPIKSMAELVAYAKANPGKLNYASGGAGGLNHYSVELFQARTGITMTHIPFNGGAPATAALVAGEVDLSFANMTDGLPQIEAGTVRGLAVTSLARSPFLPDLPTVHETVSPNFVAETWNGIMAPAKTPASIIARLSTVLVRMAGDPEVLSAMRKVGSSTVRNTPSEFRKQIEQEIVQWKPLIAEFATNK